MSNRDRLKNRPIRRHTLTFAEDPNNAVKFGAARLARDEATSDAEKAAAAAAANPESPELAAKATAAGKAAKAASKAFDKVVGEFVTFTFHLCAVPIDDVEHLQLAHRPTQQQIGDARKLNGGNPAGDPTVNMDTYPPALIAAATEKIVFSDDPDNPVTDLTGDDVADMVKAWPDQDRDLLMTWAQALSTAGSNVGDLGKD